MKYQKTLGLPEHIFNAFYAIFMFSFKKQALPVSHLTVTLQ
jgi:hypothetical protein